MDVVPAEVLADTVDRRTVDRDLCALQLDGYLRRLARQEAVCRRVLGRLARSFLAGRYHHRLGFARLGDYTRERLSLSAREVQELARVAEPLELRPSPSPRRPTLAGPRSTCRSPRTWRSSSSSDRGGTRSRSTSACAPPAARCSASTGRWASFCAPSSISACTAPSASRRPRATS